MTRLRERLRRLVARRERGAAMVEAALVTPLVLLMILGIMETSLVVKDYLGVSNAVRDGVRTAAANARVADFGARTAAAVTNGGAAVAFDGDTRLWVYKATDPNSDAPPATCSTSCLAYTWNGTKFVPAGGSWDAATQRACLGTTGGTPDRVGVWLGTDHQMLTSLVLGGDVRISDSLTMFFEPAGGCQ